MMQDLFPQGCVRGALTDSAVLVLEDVFCSRQLI